MVYIGRLMMAHCGADETLSATTSMCSDAVEAVSDILGGETLEARFEIKETKFVLRWSEVPRGSFQIGNLR